ncbi:MAG: CBS domain-containing protein [Vulcanimicrobiota bacterium]
MSEVMQPEVLCVGRSMSVRELYGEFQANEINGAPVLDENDYLVGVVTMSDIARCVAGGKRCDEPRFFAGYDVSLPNFESHEIDHLKSVKDIMSHQVHKVNVNATVEEALELMVGEDIHRVIVTHRGHVVGIVTSGDMMKLFLGMLKEEHGDQEEDDDDENEDEDDGG